MAKRGRPCLSRSIEKPAGLGDGEADVPRITQEYTPKRHDGANWMGPWGQQPGLRLFHPNLQGHSGIEACRQAITTPQGMIPAALDRRCFGQDHSRAQDGWSPGTERAAGHKKASDCRRPGERIVGRAACRRCINSCHATAGCRGHQGGPCRASLALAEFGVDDIVGGAAGAG